MNEKRERFNKIAAARVDRVIDTLRLLANCANRNNYEYDDDDVEKMFAAINAAVKDCHNAYTSIFKNDRTPFRFK